MAATEDIKMLDEILSNIGSILRIIVNKKDEFIRPELTGSFPGPWTEVLSLLDEARKKLQSQDIDWEYVEGVGLTGVQLKFKHDLFMKDRLQRKVGRILRRANSILGSLAKVLPILEPVKEYKEQVEESLSNPDATV